jgi:hypothetical protein
MMRVGRTSGSGRRWRCRFRRFHLRLRFQRALAGTGRRQHRQVDGDGGGDVLDAVGADRQGAQAMMAADAHQPGQVDGAFVGRQLVQRQHQRRVAEEVRRLGDLGGQLAVEGFEVVARQFQHGDGEHAALELEHVVGCLVWLMVCIDGLLRKKCPDL